MRKRKVTYRPGKAQGIFGIVWGCVFILIGLVVVVPAAGAFGLLWTAMAVGITAMNAYQSFGKKYRGPEIHIEEEDEEGSAAWDAAASAESHDHIPSMALDAKGRLEQLESLKSAGLITHEEYQKKREEILRGL